jgi:hypothetical protein
MMKRKFLFSILLAFAFPFILFAQNSTLRGTVLDDVNNPVQNASVELEGTTFNATTDSSGSFSLSNVPYAIYSIVIKGDNISSYKKDIEVKTATLDLGIINTEPVRVIPTGGTDNIPEVSISEDELNESTTQSVSSALTSSRDVFISTASFAFSISRFRIRGYDNSNEITLMNGVPMEDLNTDRTLFSSWSGLNDMMHNRDVSFSLSPATFSFGDLAGASSIDSRASHQRKQLQVSYAISNRAYDNRVMVSYGSGILKNGWSYALSGSRRWADEGYIPGTFYDGWSYFGSIEKQITKDQSLCLTAFGAPTISGRSAAVVQEMYDLAGTHYYNPNWGFQNGKKRNARVGDNHMPAMILTHEWNIDTKSSLESAVSYQFGKNKSSSLDWYNAPDPRPDYYRNLPSYIDANDTLANTGQNLLSENENLRQINWDKLYEVNGNNIETVVNADGIAGNNVTGKRSLYILSNRVREHKIFSLNTIYNEQVSEHLALNGGLTYQSQSTEYYQEVKDLLGGDFYVDLNKYADTSSVNVGNTSSIENDLNHPNRVLYTGDKYGYDYVAHFSKSSGWMQTVFKYSRIDFFFAADASTSSFYRTGKYRNGIFPDDSYGDSKTYTFFGGGFKGGITYKFNGRNYFYVNGAYLSKAPEFNDAFVSPTTRNRVADNLRNENIQSVEGGWIYRAPRLKARITGYLTQFDDETRTSRFYLEGTTSSTFVNYTMTGIDKRHSGIEVATEASIGYGLSATAVASVGQFIYTSRPLVIATQDNYDKTIISNQEVFIENLRVGGSPQSAYSFGINYRSKQYWFLNVNLNYFDNMFLDFGPARRTLAALDAIDKDSPIWNQILSQEKFGGQFTMDVSAGWSWKINNKFKALKKNTFLVFNLGVTNILNNKNLVIGGYEQTRFSADGMFTDVDKYPSRLSYGFGATYFASVILRMN